MFVPFKNEDGKWMIRPALIGFIKNNKARRVMMILYWPFTLIVTFMMNYAMVFFAFSFEFIRLTFRHIAMLKTKPWKDPVWDNPRVK